MKSKFSLLGGVYTGSLDLKLENGVLNILVSPKDMPQLDLTFYLQPKFTAGQLVAAKLGYQAVKGGKTMMKYDGELNRENSAAKYHSKYNSKMQVGGFIQIILLQRSFNLLDLS